MKNPRLCHLPSPREQGFFPFVPVWIWSREVTLHLIWAERLGAELLATLFDPYLKRRGDHRLSDRIWFYLFHFIFPSALAVALWDMHTPALQVYPWPQQGLNQQSAICALQPAILYLCVSHTALPGPLLVLLYQIKKQNSPSALKENVCALPSLIILFYSICIHFVKTSWVSPRVGFSDQELKEQWVKRNDLDTWEPCDGNVLLQCLPSAPLTQVKTGKAAASAKSSTRNVYTDKGFLHHTNNKCHIRREAGKHHHHCIAPHLRFVCFLSDSRLIKKLRYLLLVLMKLWIFWQQ